MSTFAEHFDLYDPDRVSLELDPRRDAKIYVDVHGVMPKIKDILVATSPAPKLLVTGEWGMGKSHTLWHVATELLPELADPAHEVFVKLGGLTNKARFLDVYRQIIQALREPLEDALRQLADLTDDDLAGLTQDGRLVLRSLGERLRADADAPELGALRMWLSGAGPTPTQAMRLGLGTRLKDSPHHQDLVPLLLAASRIIARAKKSRPVIFIDESTAFRMPRGQDAKVSISEGLRELFDQDNRDLGIVLGMYDRGAPWLRLDVLQRLENRRVELSPLVSTDEVAEFTRRLGHEMGRRHLFGPGAIDRFSTHVLKARLPGLDPTSPGSPRSLLKLLDALLQQAYKERVPLPLPAERVAVWLPADVA